MIYYSHYIETVLFGIKSSRVIIVGQMAVMESIVSVVYYLLACRMWYMGGCDCMWPSTGKSDTMRPPSKFFFTYTFVSIQISSSLSFIALALTVSEKLDLPFQLAAYLICFIKTKSIFPWRLCKPCCAQFSHKWSHMWVGIIRDVLCMWVYVRVWTVNHANNFTVKADMGSNGENEIVMSCH